MRCLKLIHQVRTKKENKNKKSKICTICSSKKIHFYIKKNGFNIEGKMDNFFQYKNRRVKKIIFGLNKANFKNFDNKKTKN